MTTYTDLEDAALRAELAHNWAHAADLWRQARRVAVSARLQLRCERFEAECRAIARRRMPEGVA